MLLEAKQIEKTIGEKTLFKIPEWHIYAGDRIGIVGRNGSGKTTLMHVLAKKELPDSGTIRLNGAVSLIEQLTDDLLEDTLSGGEKTKERIHWAFSVQAGILFADEPTSHLDKNGRMYLEKQIAQFEGAVVVISHDRAFLNRTCNQIVELDDGKVHFYHGNYDHYRAQKDLETELAKDEYQAYVKEKKRLKKVMEQTHQKSESIQQAPKRMGPSEARLHKMGGQQNRKTLDNQVKNVEKRMEHLEVKERPNELPPITIQLDKGREVHNPILISGTNISKKIGERVLFEQLEFQLLNHSRTALVGPNGAGKTTLIKTLLKQEKGIHYAKNVRVGYFSQSLDLLDEEETVLNNVMQKTTKEEAFVRMLLARLLFIGDDVYKPVSVLSGGEKNKVSLALLLVSDANVLVLDEPTNYLDIPSMEAVEEALKGYEGTLLFVSHDEQFIRNSATHLWQIEEGKLVAAEMENGRPRKHAEKTHNLPQEEERLVLENRLNAVIAQLSFSSKQEEKELLEQEYTALLQQLKAIKV